MAGEGLRMKGTNVFSPPQFQLRAVSKCNITSLAAKYQHYSVF